MSYYRKELEHYVSKYLVEHPVIRKEEVTEEHVYETLKVCVLPLRFDLVPDVRHMILEKLQ